MSAEIQARFYFEKVKELHEQNELYREAMTAAISEAECIMFQGKSKQVDIEYARNIRRYLNKALESESE